MDFTQKLWIVTGKGGVGKTTLSAALGFLSADRGEDTLLVETHGLTHLGELLGMGKVGYQPKKVAPHLWLCQLNAEKALEEYILEQIKVRMIYNMVFKNRYVRHFLDAAPGLSELLIIGKIWALTRPKGFYRNKKTFRRVIVDAPSTGHGLSLLTVPKVVSQAVRIGPLKSKAEEILNFLKDEKSTMVWLATLPEDLPITETVEMAAKLGNEVKVPLGPILINSLWPEILEETTTKQLKQLKNYPIVEAYQKRLSLSQFYLDKLKSQLPDKIFLELPLVYQTVKPLEITRILDGKIRAQLEAMA